MNISVVMATYNGEKYIREQLTSIISQLSQDDELFISDDGSTDGTLAILEQFSIQDNRIRLLNGPGKGHIKNFEYALYHTKNDLIFFSDQDDIWLPGKVEKILRIFEEQEPMVVLHDMYDATDEQIKNHLLSHYTNFQVRKVKHGFFYNWLKSGYFGCCMVINKNFKEILLDFPESVNMHDQWIGLLGEFLKESVFIDEPLIIHRLHGNNVSARLSVRKKIFYRLVLLYSFLETLPKMYNWRKKKK